MGTLFPSTRSSTSPRKALVFYVALILSVCALNFNCVSALASSSESLTSDLTQSASQNLEKTQDQALVLQSEINIVHGVPQHRIESLLNQDWPTGSAHLGEPASAVLNSKQKKRPSKVVVRPPCDLSAKAALCVANGKRVEVPDAVSAGTVGLYSFNERLGNRVIDRSGNSNHGILGPMGQKLSFEPGPDRLGGSGSSMSINGVSYLHVRPSTSINRLAEEFTASFWIHLADPDVSALSGGCTLFNIAGNKVSVLPTHQLSLEIKSRPSVTAQASLRVGAWTHVAVSFSSKQNQFSLYVNGIPDLQLPTSFESAMDINVYVGGTPHTQCKGFTAFMDDVRLSSKPVNVQDISSDTFSTLGGAEASFTRIGCSRNAPCSWEQARVACPAGYHICAKRELSTGGYQTARSLGWVSWNDEIWTSEDAAYEQDHAIRKVALCCAFQ